MDLETERQEHSLHIYPNRAMQWRFNRVVYIAALRSGTFQSGVAGYISGFLFWKTANEK